MTEAKSVAEVNIREECRRQYREDGTIDCPYPSKSMESQYWHNEALKITREEIRSSMYG